MRANELRIGNYLELLGKIVKVEGVSNLPTRKEMYWIACNAFKDTKIIHFKPIKLTEEWLLKLGFIKSIGWDDFEYFDKNGVHIYVCNDGNDEWLEYEMEFKVKSVHQLQNLYFALKNEELWLN